MKIQEWQKADARILGQILAAQNIIFVLPDIGHIAEFYAQALISVPGITSCRICMGDVSAQAGEMESSFCTDCEALRKASGEKDIIIPANLDFKCNLAGQPGMRSIAIDSYQHHFGFFVFKIENATVFDLYQPFISNLANNIAISLENRLQEDLLQKAHDELEHRIEERTKELIKANELLLQEITQRKRAEMEIARVNRALVMLNNTNQALIHTTDETMLLNEVCRIAVDVGGYRMAWVGFAEHDEAKTLRPVAHAGFESGYIESARVTWADDERGRGPGVIAIRTGQPSIARNILVDPAFAPWRESAIQHGYKSIIALPLISEGQTLGALGIYSAETDAFDKKEVEILSELAGDLAFGITAVRTRAKRDQAEEEIKHERNKSQLYFEAAGALLVIINTDQEVELINQRGCKILGFPRDQIIGRNWFDNFVPERLRREVKETFSKLISGELEPVEFYENEILDRNGEEKLILWHNRLIFDDSGKIIATISSGEDITEHKRAEEQMRYQAALLANVNDAIVASDENYKLTAWNAAAESLYGWKAKEVLGRSGLEIVQTDYLGADKDKMLRTIEAAGRWRGEVTQVRKDGTRIPVEVSSIVLHDEKGRITGYVSVNRDITGRKQAEEALRASEKYLKEAQRVGRLGSWDWDATTDTITWSEEYYRIYGFDPTQVPPGYEEHKKAYTPESAARLDAAVKRNMETGESYELDLELATTQGPCRWITARSETKRDAQGHIIGLRGTAQDITERKRTEEELKKYRDHLEEMVKERTLQLDLKNQELEKFNRLFVGRELRMIELKKRIAELEKYIEDIKKTCDKP